ncbi:hypothetical protein FDK38_003635 [Candidozyma auris]|nr:hypothetical protein FDK38_003635 [[Candida] auris]
MDQKLSNYNELFQTVSTLEQLTSFSNKKWKIPLAQDNYVDSMKTLTEEAGFGKVFHKAIEQVYLWKKVTKNFENEESSLTLTSLCEATSVTKNENASCKRRRSHLTMGIKEYLEQVFKKKPHPTRSEYEVIARSCNLSSRQVRVWFTNKRYRSKPRGNLKEEDEDR